MSPETAVTAVNTPENPIVQIDRTLFKRIEEQKDSVEFTERELTKAANEHKEAKKRHESALATMTALVASMVRKVNGISDEAPLPLFDNQTDAIEAANADPIVSTLVSRMLDHGISHVNALIVAGYNEGERNELAQYLDAMDLRKAALAQPEGFEPVPEVVVPAFLVEQEISEEEVGGALREVKVEMKKKHIRLMSQEQRRMALDYSAAVQAVQLRLGEAVTFDDLPPAPSFIASPKELEAAKLGEIIDAEVPADEPVKNARAPRRSSKTFKNTPRVAGKVKKAKGQRAGSVN